MTFDKVANCFADYPFPSAFVVCDLALVSAWLTIKRCVVNDEIDGAGVVVFFRTEEDRRQAVVEPRYSSVSGSGPDHHSLDDYGFPHTVRVPAGISRRQMRSYLREIGIAKGDYTFVLDNCGDNGCEPVEYGLFKDPDDAMMFKLRYG